ncbi:MAG: acyl-CoA dehydrogenase family protein [Desulfuromonas sp.]|nr:acyl-CoA dehydrogenase family protein [Desulfuromonas sp.]
MIKALTASALHPLIDQIAALGKEIIKPHAAQWDRDNQFPHQAIQTLATHGLLGICVDERWGGMGKSLTELAVIIEGIARYDAGTALTLAAHGLVCDHLQLFGDEAQQQRYLPRLARGDILGGWALAEAGSGSDAASIKTRAEKNEDGWLINGRKMFVTQGSVAGLYVVMARSGEHRRSAISAFLVERELDGVKPSAPLEKLGCRSSNTSALHLDAVQVSDQQRLGEEHRALSAAFILLDRGRVGIAALACGLIRASLEDSRCHARRRQQFGQPIASFQAIQWPLAEMATHYDAGWLLTAHAAMLCNSTQPCGTSAAKAKLFASQAAVKSSEQAVQIHGGYGYLKNLPVERYFRDAKLCEIGEGTSEIQKLVIARELLKEE